MPPAKTFKNEQPKYVQVKKHVDHDHIVKRLEQYIKAYRTGKPESMIEFYHPEKLTYSDFGTDREGMDVREVHKLFDHTFSNFHGLNIETLSVHGHKDFTAWEWQIVCKPAIEGGTGNKLSEEEAPQKKFVGCTLMWWENDKIIRNHDYVLAKDAVSTQ